MSVRSSKAIRFAVFAGLGLSAALFAEDPARTGTPTGWRQHDVSRPRPPVVDVPPPVATPVPADAVVLFDGKSLDAWKGAGGGPAHWKLGDGWFEVEPGAGAIQTNAGFGDVQLHVEWASPKPAVGVGQDRGNSGIFLMGQYEIQVLDSYKADTYADGQAGALYGQYPPLFNAARPPGEWQTYDIAFRRPRFDAAGKLVAPARVTLIHNGVLVQNNEELLGGTNWLRWTPFENVGDKGPISLQDHGHSVRFRNIWLRNLPERPSPTAEALSRPARIKLSEADLEAFVGSYTAGGPKDQPIKITRRGGSLEVKFPFRRTTVAIEPIGPTEFDMPNTDGRWTFFEPDAVKFRIGDGERVYRRVK